MATMSQTWSIFTAVTVLAALLCTGDKSCKIWSSKGTDVERGSSFKVFCTFNCKWKGSMYSYLPRTLQTHQHFNSTTIYLNVVNITMDRTYSCECSNSPNPCGLDFFTGYPPEPPKNISCILYQVPNNGSGVVTCTWQRGRQTYFKDSSELWVTTLSGNGTVGQLMCKGSSERTDSLSASFNVSSSVQLISVQVRVQNALSSEVSSTVNYTLSEIVTPPAPVLGQPECSSRDCIIKVVQSVSTQQLEIQYSTEAQHWTSYPDSAGQMSLVQDRSISSLEPYTLYHFRARSKFIPGLWSQWSTNIYSWTQEEAPAKELDVWYAESASDFKSLRVYWKEANSSISRGKITQYKVEVYNQDSALVFINNTSAEARNYLVPFCANCEVKVWACNSKGESPSARITTNHTEDLPFKNVQVTADEDNVTISWGKPETAALSVAYVVEWYPEGLKLEELRWLRLGREGNFAVLTGTKPFECYEGALYVFYNESSVHRTRFTGVTTLESAPATGPSVQEKVEGNKVKLTWTEIPRDQRGGCINKYTIYLEDGSGYRQPHSLPASERVYILSLSPAVYSLWMTASTSKGEGPAGQKIKFLIQQESQAFLVPVCVGISLIGLILMCLCQCSAVKQRLRVYFQCLILDDVPDPKNSKWAKECTREKGNMGLLLQLSSSGLTKEEEEPVLVDVEELPRPSPDLCTPVDVSSLQGPPQSSQSTLFYPLTTYIKSFSHDSDSSEHTHTSMDTNTTTADYISSHGLGNMDEEGQEEEEEDQDEEECEILGFFPSHNIMFESLAFGGKLTLDAVKIDCNDFFQNS